MQPWQAAGEATKKSAQLPFVQMAKAANLLSYAIPTGMAVQGLSKLNPVLGKFFDLADKFGFSREEALDNVKEKFNKSEQSTEKSLFERLIGDVDLASLGESIQKKLQKLVPIANQLEKKGKKEGDSEVNNLKNNIKKILKGAGGSDKLSIDNIIQSGENLAELQPEQQQLQDMVMGSMDQGQQQPMQPDQGQMGQPQQPGMGQPQQPQQPGQGQAALMAILQKIQATRGPGG